MSEGTDSQWEKLQQMRRARGETVSEPARETPAGEEIEVEGVGKVRVDPSLAAAHRKATAIKQEAAKNAEREQLRAEVREELRAELQPPTAPAAPAVAEPAPLPKLPPPPDSALLITDPEEWQR